MRHILNRISQKQQQRLEMAARRRRPWWVHVALLPLYVFTALVGSVFGAVFFAFAAVASMWRFILSAAALGGAAYVTYCVLSHYGIDMTPWN